MVLSADALCILNQSTDLQRLGRLLQKDEIDSVFMVTTHRLFPSERERLNRLPAGVLGVADFGELLDDDELLRCDDDASIALAEHIGKIEFASRHRDLSGWKKNEMIAEKLAERVSSRRVYYARGLGIHAGYWSGVPGAKEIPGETDRGLVRRMWQFLSRHAAVIGRRFSRVRVSELLAEDHRVFLLGSSSRLRLRPDTLIRTHHIANAGDALRSLVQASTSASTSIAFTIHDYHQPPELGIPVEILVDGLHPSNYPRSYIDMYAKDATFVVRDMLDEGWFGSNGKKTRPGYSFLDPGYMASPDEINRIERVYLMLNHAGDWSAMINRSDTDALILATASLARQYPDVSFVVRPHPGAAHAEHEGEGALARLKAFVSEAGLANLDVSSSDLATDIESAQVIISEYSAVLVDGIRSGKLGLIVNLTRRRSFMQDYTDLGIATATGEAELSNVFAALVAAPDGFVSRQAQAVSRYNAALRDFLQSQPKSAVEKEVQ